MLDFKKIYTDENNQERVVENKEKLCPPDGCTAILDTGTYLIYGPPKYVNNVIKDIYIESCQDKSSMPDLVFTFAGEDH